MEHSEQLRTLGTVVSLGALETSGTLVLPGAIETAGKLVKAGTLGKPATLGALAGKLGTAGYLE